MSPRPWSPCRTLVVAIGLLVAASACGSSDPTAGPPTTPVRSEPARGRADPTRSADAAPVVGDRPEAGDPTTIDDPGVVTGAQALVDDGLSPLLGRRVGLIANRASTVGDRRLIDVIDDHPDVELVALFAPEHGVEAVEVAGVEVLDGTDAATGVPIQSLYDDDRSPDPELLAQLDVLVFDLQDAGARFYTYTSTLGLAMQAAAAAQVPVLVLDRPNPFGGEWADGDVLVDGQRSFVGLYPVPAVHGLTVGELALAIRGEGWLDGLEDLELEVVGLRGWERRQSWADTGLGWTPPSPGMPSAESTLLYPATVLLEATTVSFGRGSDRPFGQFGAPWLDAESVANRLEAAGLPGVAFEPVRFLDEDGTTLPGVRLLVTDEAALRPSAVGVHVLHELLTEPGGAGLIDRPDFFDLLAGTATLRADLVAGLDPASIVESWADELARWDETRAPYLLYGDRSG